ncbi:hypothetical protein HOLleu_42586 [Holothuria leucospilota]|uniref:Peptidase A2 domain-containing protein n=1 Tax=Holothuria leucospilota TaxID=206669 RepID=A0A9Q0YAR1_HOLLE|nr:hypothetical protein HOLleu_42586 [Holothuria leucospilota]
MVQETSHTLPAEEFFVDTITSKDVDSTWLLPLAVNGSIIPFKLDMGADVNLMPKKDYQTLRSKPRLHKVQATVNSYGGAKIPILEKCRATVSHKGSKYELAFMIVAEKDQPILGLQACEKLNLIQRVCTVETEEQLTDQTYAQLLNEYSDVFQGLGCLQYLGSTKLRWMRMSDQLFMPAERYHFG